MAEQQKSKLYTKAGTEERGGFLAVFLVISVIFALFYLLARGNINPGSFGGCSFERNYGLPCPSCGMTRSVTAFMQGKIIKSFLLQPAAAIGCFALVLAAFFSLLSALLGVNFWFLPPVRMWRTGRILFAAAVVLAVGWAVTLARAFAQMP
jgi:membrane protein insertase Oxa1/YidC/SpoIIIJ